MFSGMVADATTLLPVPNATVLLHRSLTDTTLTKTLPVAATRTDAYGYFVLRNLKDTTYNLFVITDENKNNRYDRQEGEWVGFSDSLIVPQKMMFPYAPEIQPYFAKDTAGLLKRPLETTLFLFKEPATRQVLSHFERTRPRTLQLAFSAPGADIVQTSIPGMDSTRHRRTTQLQTRHRLVVADGCNSPGYSPPPSDVHGHKRFSEDTPSAHRHPSFSASERRREKRRLRRTIRRRRERSL